MRTVLCLGALLFLQACAGAKPYQRGVLAMSAMQFDDDPQASLVEEHVYTYREGSTGAYGGGGGGCGCN